MKLTVIFICYNQALYVAQALESILRQKTSFQYEILIADDASTDATPQILKEYAMRFSARIQLTLREHNLGPTANAYPLFMSAQGEYIASLEGDDYWNDDYFLERQVSFLEAHPEYIAVQDKCLVVDENGVPIDRKNDSVGNDFWKFDKEVFTLNDFLAWKSPGHMSAMVYRNIYRFNPDDYSAFYQFHPYIGDKTTLMQLVLRGTIYCSNHYSMCYRLKEYGTNNWMAKYQSENRRADEYYLILRIERHMQEKLSESISMDTLERNKIAAAAIVFFLNPSKRNYDVLITILRAREIFPHDLIIAIRAILKKAWWILRGDPLHRVDV